MHRPALIVAALLVLSAGLAAASTHEDYSAPRDGFSAADGVLVEDTAVYNTGYVSENGSDWTAITLTGENSHSNWILGSASSDVDLQNIRYVAIYSCTWNAGWDCSQTWQVRDRGEQGPVCGNGVVESGEECDGGPGSAVCGDVGYNRGSVACSSCVLDYSACYNATSSNGSLSIVEDGQALADIVVAPDAAPMVQLAAEYFQGDIQDMTGATLPINDAPDTAFDFHVYIGESQYTDDLGIAAQGTEHDGYKIVSGDGYLVLLGDDEQYDDSLEMSDSEWESHTAPDTWLNVYAEWRAHHGDRDLHEQDGRGTMNAVHDFLHEQGMRWYYPTEYGTITPDKQDISFASVDKTVNSPFRLRSFYLFYKKFGHIDNEGVYPDDHEYGGGDDWLRWVLSLGKNSKQPVIGGMAHGIDIIIEHPQTKANHPEYYAIWNGERRDGDNYKPDLCSEELKQEAIRYAKTMIETYDVEYVNLWPTDGYTRASESSQECKDRETPERGPDGYISDYVWDFINDVAWAVHDEYGDEHKVLSGAYSAYKLPPTNLTDPRGAAPNLATMLVMNRIDHNSPEQWELRKQVIEDWNEIAPGEVFLNDKYLKNWDDRPTTATIPHFRPHLISEDFKFVQGKSNGGRHEVATTNNNNNGGYDNFAATGHNIYVTSRLYWDPGADVDEILNEYYDVYYGPAQDTMRELHEYSEDNLLTIAYNPVHLKNMRALAEQALTEVPGGSVYEQRIQPLLDLMNGQFAGEQVDISSCQTLDSPGTTYRLTQDVSTADSCFFIDHQGVTLDCQGHTITYGGDYGVWLDERQSGRGHYYTIRDCNIEDSGSGEAGIWAYLSDHGLIEDTNITTPGSGRGLWVSQGFNNTVRNVRVNDAGQGLYAQYGNLDGPDRNTYENNYFRSNSGNGATMHTVEQSTIRNNEFSGADAGLRMFNPKDSVLEDNVISSDSQSALYITGAQNLQQSGNTVNDG